MHPNQIQNLNQTASSQVKNYARVADSIIGWGSSIGRWARIDNKSVIGEDVHIKARRRAFSASRRPALALPPV